MKNTKVILLLGIFSLVLLLGAGCSKKQDTSSSSTAKKDTSAPVESVDKAKTSAIIIPKSE